MKTNWFLSLIANSCAVALAILINSFYTTEKLKKSTTRHQTFKFRDYLLSFLLSVLGAFLAYAFVYGLAGYLPMTRQWTGLIHNVNSRVIPWWEEISTYPDA